MLFIEKCPLLSYYAASGVNFLPTFQYTLLIPSLRVNNLKRKPAVHIRSLFGQCGR